MALSSGERDRGSTFVVDSDGRLKVVLSDSSGTSTTVTPGDTDANASVPVTAARGQVWDDRTSKWAKIRGSRADGNAVSQIGVALSGLGVSDLSSAFYPVAFPADSRTPAFTLPAANMVFNGATFDQERTPTVFKSVANGSITAGTPATYWTPTSGKKFRLMTLSLSMSIAGQILVCDNTNGSIILRSPQLAAAGVWTIGAGDIGNGILSAAANNVLKLDVTGTASVGGFVGGTEE